MRYLTGHLTRKAHISKFGGVSIADVKAALKEMERLKPNVYNWEVNGEMEVEMSLVKEIAYEARDVRAQDPAETTYSVASVDGEIRVQLQSYGRAGRKGASATQTLQFTKDSAKQLVDVMRREFGF